MLKELYFDVEIKLLSPVTLSTLNLLSVAGGSWNVRVRLPLGLFARSLSADRLFLARLPLGLRLRVLFAFSGPMLPLWLLSLWYSLHMLPLGLVFKFSVSGLILPRGLFRGSGTILFLGDLFTSSWFAGKTWLKFVDSEGVRLCLGVRFMSGTKLFLGLLLNSGTRLILEPYTLLSGTRLCLGLLLESGVKLFLGLLLTSGTRLFLGLLL